MVERRKTKRQWPALLFFLVLSLACLALALLPIKRGSAESIPVPLHSELTANYNADPPSTPIPGIQLDIIKDVIHSEAASEVSERLSNLENTLKTPVLMVTPLPTPVIIVTFIPQPQPSLVAPVPTLTVPLPTPTLRPTKKPKPTHGLPIITKTPRPTHNLPLITKTPKPKKKPTRAAPSSTTTLQPGQLTATLPGLPTLIPTHKIKLPKSTETPSLSTAIATLPFSTPAVPLSTPVLLLSTPTLFLTPIISLP